MSYVFRFAAVALALAIAVLSLLPISGQPSIQHADKIQHFVAYGGLAGLLGLGWRRWPLGAVFLMAVAFGIGVEIAQGLSGTGRSASVLDMLANAAGAGGAVFILRWIAPR